MQRHTTFADLSLVIPAVACHLLAAAIRARLVVRFRREGRKPALRTLWETAPTERVAL